MTDSEFRILITPKIITFIDNCVYKITGRQDEDVRQDALLKALRNCSKFDGRYLRAWLYRITYNAAIDKIRYEDVRKTVSITEVDYWSKAPEGAHEQFEALNELESLQKVLRREDYRILELSAIGYNLKEVAAEMKISYSLCKNKKYRARELINKLKDIRDGKVSEN